MEDKKRLISEEMFKELFKDGTNLVLPKDAGNEDDIIEDFSIEPEERKEILGDMREDALEGMESQMREQAMKDILEDMKQKKLKRAEMLMKKYGKR